MSGETGDARVLIVPEAEGPDADRLSAALDATVASVATAQQALADLEDADCVVTGYDLPDGDGIELLERVRERRPQVPVVLCPATHDGTVASRAVAAGVSEYVPRDGERERVVDRVRATLEADEGTPVAGYDRVFDESPAAVLIYDTDFEIQYANGAAAEIAGVDDPEEMVGTQLDRYVAEESSDRARERMRRVAVDRERIERAEVLAESVDGEVRHVEVAGAPITYAGRPAGQAIVTDVTERKQRAERFRQERDRFTRLFESIPASVIHVELDDETPVVRRVNSRFEETFGYEQEALAGESLDEFIVPEEQRDRARELNRTTAGGESVEVELTRETTDGPRDFLFHAVPLDTPDDPTEVIGIYVDITEQKERERELQETNERLDEFAGVVSHDLRNPLNVIWGRLELARETGDDEHFDAIERGIERMERLIENLLALARDGDTIGDRRPITLKAASENAWGDVDADGATLTVESGATVRADADRLEDLFANLFRNSVEHATGDQTATDADDGPAVHIRVGEHEDGFYVEDDGPGIPDEKRERVFERGYSTDGGPGYGLAIVRQVVEAHGWDIAVTESESGGARFEITTDE